MVAIYTVWYNGVRVPKTLRVTPAMEAKLTHRVWEMADIDNMIGEVAKPEAQSH